MSREPKNDEAEEGEISDTEVSFGMHSGHASHPADVRHHRQPRGYERGMDRDGQVRVDETNRTSSWDREMGDVGSEPSRGGKGIYDTFF